LESNGTWRGRIGEEVIIGSTGVDATSDMRWSDNTKEIDEVIVPVTNILKDSREVNERQKRGERCGRE